MPVSPSVYNAFLICHRQAWLMSRQMNADQENTYLDIGRLISEETFEREKKEIYIPDLGAKIDLITKKDGEFFIAEVKKSSTTLKSGINQLKYYLFLLKSKGFNLKGMIKIPAEKKSITIELTEEDEAEIKKNLEAFEILMKEPAPPAPVMLKICPKCAHYEFCYC